jgi:hypothetical protein
MFLRRSLPPLADVSLPEFLLAGATPERVINAQSQPKPLSLTPYFSVT